MTGYKLNGMLADAIEHWSDAFARLPIHPTQGRMVAVPEDLLTTILEGLGWQRDLSGKFFRSNGEVKYDACGAVVMTGTGFMNPNNADYYSEAVRNNIANVPKPARTLLDSSEVRTPSTPNPSRQPDRSTK